MPDGTLSIASDVHRVPPQSTSMGEVVTIGHSAVLAEVILRMLDNRACNVRPRGEIQPLYSTPRTTELDEQLFERLIAEKSHRTVARKVCTLSMQLTDQRAWL